MSRSWSCLLFAVFALATTASQARADGRTFVDIYPAHVEEKGERELEVWTTALTGQADTTLVAWENRVGFEYALTDRLTGKMLLNWEQSGGAETAARFVGPSFVLHGAFAEEGKLPFDPAFELEARENGDEFEFEPSLLLWHEHQGWILGADVEGTLAWLHHVPAGGETTEKGLAAMLGAAREFGEHVAFGFEGSWQHAFESEGDSPSALFFGPTLDLRGEKANLTIGWHPQVWGTPETGAGINLAAFPRSEFRVILGLEL